MLCMTYFHQTIHRKCLLLNLLLCFLSFTSGSAQSIYDSLTTAEKVYGLSTIWKEASYNFVYFDKVPSLNWDSTYKATIPQVIAAKNVYEYYQVISHFMDLLQDGHTRVLTTQYFYKDIDSPPFSYVLVEGRPFISRIDKNLLATIPIGSEILTIDHKPLKEFISSGGRLSGIKRSRVVLRLKTPQGQLVEQTLSRNINADRVVLYPPRNVEPDVFYKPLSSNIAYVAINTFGNDSVPTKFRQVLPQLRQAKALIIDLRKNGGGNSNYARQIADYLVDTDYTVGPAWKTRIHNGANKAFGSVIIYNKTDSLALINQDYYRGTVWQKHAPDTVRIGLQTEKLTIPVAVLIGRSTFSAAEDFLIMLRGASRITTVGQFTAGSSGQPILFSLPAGLMGQVCAKRDTYPNGQDYIGIGIKPDVLIERSVSDYQKNRDVELESSVQLLGNKLKSK